MNLPISTNAPQPATAQAASANQAPDDQASQAADPFGSVLARQLAGGSATDSASSTATSGQGIITAATDKKDNKQPNDAANTPPADMLAALLAAPVAQAAAKPAETTTAAVDMKGKTVPLDNGKPALQFPAEAADMSKSAHKPGMDSKAQNFASALNTVDAKAHHASTLETQLKALPQADTPQPAAAALSQFAQNNPLAAAGSVPAKLTVDTPVGSKNWGDDFNQKITWMATSKEQSAELHLNPPNLGPLDVVLNVSGDQATAMFTSPHAAVREAVEQALPKLREMMADNGIMLGNATVSDQAPRDNQAGQQARGQQRTSSATSGSSVDGIAGLSQGTRPLPARRHNGLVDTFA